MPALLLLWELLFHYTFVIIADLLILSYPSNSERFKSPVGSVQKQKAVSPQRSFVLNCIRRVHRVTCSSADGGTRFEILKCKCVILRISHACRLQSRGVCSCEFTKQQLTTQRMYIVRVSDGFVNSVWDQQSTSECFVFMPPKTVQPRQSVLVWEAVLRLSLHSYCSVMGGKRALVKGFLKRKV